jgi:hypothetical protein
LGAPCLGEERRYPRRSLWTGFQRSRTAKESDLLGCRTLNHVPCQATGHRRQPGDRCTLGLSRGVVLVQETKSGLLREPVASCLTTMRDCKGESPWMSRSSGASTRGETSRQSPELDICTSRARCLGEGGVSGIAYDSMSSDRLYFPKICSMTSHE